MNGTEELTCPVDTTLSILTQTHQPVKFVSDIHARDIC